MEITYKITRDEFIKAEELLFLKTCKGRLKLLAIILSIIVFIFNLFNEKDIINFTLNTIIPIVLLVLLLVIEGKVIIIVHKKSIAKRIDKSWSGDKKDLIITEQNIKYLTSAESYEISRDKVYVYEINEYIYISISRNKVIIVPINSISEENRKLILKINKWHHLKFI